jgi:hypothetical protein
MLNVIWLFCQSAADLKLLPCVFCVACRSRELRSLEDTHQVQQRWALGSCQLLDGVAQLCLHRVSSLQAALATCSSLYAYTLYLQEHMGPARKVHRSLDQQLSRQRTKMRGLIKQLLGWVCELQRTVQHLLPVGGVSSDSLRQQALASVGLQPGEAVSETADHGWCQTSVTGLPLPFDAHRRWQVTGSVFSATDRLPSQLS